MSSGGAAFNRRQRVRPILITMPTSPKSRIDLETVQGLKDAIRALPSDPEVPKGTQGYNRYTTQRAHWLGWLGDTPGTGSYERKTPPGKGAEHVYNRIGEPKMLLWVIEASGVHPSLVAQAKSAASVGPTLAGKAKAIRQVVPYSAVADALWSNRARAGGS
jgi:hypothetical protein